MMLPHAHLLALSLTLALTTACGAPDDPALSFPDGQAPPDAARDAPPDEPGPPDWQPPPDAAPPDGALCWPGYAYGCSSDETGVQICLDDASGFRIAPCVSASGGPGHCAEGHCTPCVPGERFCRGEEEVYTCDESGQTYSLSLSCQGETTGKVCVAGACVGLCELALKWNTYMGCDTWAVDLDNAYLPGEASDAQGAPFAVVVSNPDERLPATVTITRWNRAEAREEVVTGRPFDLDNGESDPAKPFPGEPLGPGELRVYYLPRRDVNGTTLAPLAYHLVSSVPVTAYQFNPLENMDVKSNDASLLLPSNVLGTAYRVMNREQTYAYLRGFLTVVAVSGGETQVSVRVTATTLPGEGLPRLQAGDSTGVLTLNRFDVLNIETDEPGADLTGSLVLASKPVAVFAGLECANVPNTERCGADGLCEWDGETPCAEHEDCFAFITGFCDHLEQQMWPITAWGRRYLCGKSFDRATESDAWRVLAAEDGTRVTTVPPQADLPVLHAGEWVEFLSDEHFELVADKPVMVGQFLAGQDAPTPGKVSEALDANIGDPAFLIQVPIEQFRADYVFLAPDKYELDYVTVHAPKGATVRFDDEPIDDALWAAYGPGEWRVARFRINDGVHRVVADQPVGVYIYGYDYHVSYGYPAGLDLARINEDVPSWPLP